MSAKRKVLIIEDEFILSQALKMSLSAHYEVLLASDGEMGHNLLMNEKPDAVLLDIFLPKMNGFEILEKAKKDDSTKNIPVIIMSNCGGDKDIEKGLKLGAVAYLVKAETELQGIVDKVNEVLG